MGRPLEAAPTADGTVFSVPVTGGSPTVLASFDGSNGRYPAGGLTLSGNNLYGTTDYGGTIAGGMCGVVFSVPVSGGSPTVLGLVRRQQRPVALKLV